MNRSHSVFAVVVLLVLACSDDPVTGPAATRGPVFTELWLRVPHTGNGALLVTLRGGVIDSVTSPELKLATLETAAAEYRMLVRGQLHDGAIVRLWVPDRTAAFRATIEQVTDGYQSVDVTGYALVATALAHR